MNANDRSNGYEAIAEAFVHARSPSIGPAVVSKWMQRLPPGASILDIGCGYGVSISQTLLQQGFAFHGVDASETLVGEFRRRFPDAAVECSSVEESTFFHRTFDAVVAWGLMFLLPPETQRHLIGKVAHVLNQPGYFLFTSPREACSWLDGMTDLPSVSLGHDEYEHVFKAHGLALIGNDEDEGGNYYYFAAKT